MAVNSSWPPSDQREPPKCHPRQHVLSDVLQLSLHLQGRTFGAPGLTAPAMNSESRTRAVERERAARVTRRRRPGFNLGDSPLRGGPLRRVLRTQVLRRGGSPRTAPPVTGRLRSSPYPAAAPASTTAGATSPRQVRRKP
jgi:hypothetical protein